MAAKNRLITLNNGVQMPILGFGVFQVADEHTEQVVADALAGRLPGHRYRRLLRQ